MLFTKRFKKVNSRERCHLSLFLLISTAFRCAWWFFNISRLQCGYFLYFRISTVIMRYHVKSFAREYRFGVASSLLPSILDNCSVFSLSLFSSIFFCCLFLTQTTIITMIRNNPPMETPIIISIVSDCVSGLSVVKRSVRLKNVVSVPSVQDILITYSEVVLTSILEFSDRIREASENECISYKMKNKQKIPQMT